MHANTYLRFAGDCEEAFKYYARVCGGAVETMSTYSDTPAAAQMPPDWLGKIIHATLRLGDTIIMGADAPPSFYSKPQGFALTLSVDSPAEAERIFAAFSEGGASSMPMAPTFFAERFGMVVDRFGTPWIVICERTAG